MRKKSPRGAPITEARLLAICETLPNIARGSDAHFALLRELAGDPASVTSLHGMLSVRDANTIIPAISVLPEDILSMVFSAFADVAPPLGPMLYSDSSMKRYAASVANLARGTEKKEKDPTGRVLLPFGAGHSTLGWIELGHVCAIWRTLLFRMPSLWARCLGTLPGPAFDGMLYWAGDIGPVSLSTLCSSMRPGAEDEVAAALRHDTRLAQRVECMRFERTEREDRVACPFNQILDQTKVGSFTNLRKLEVFANIIHGPALDYHSFPAIDAPKLSHLRFEDFFLRWTSSVLVELDITGAAVLLNIPVLLIMDLLRVSANTLSSLCLHNCMNTDIELAKDALQGAAPVLLPHLDQFKLGSTVDFCILFLLQGIAIRQTTFCTITTTHALPTLAPLLPLLRFAWETFVSSSSDIGIVMSDPRRHERETPRRNLHECTIDFFEGVEAENGLADGTVSPMVGRRPKLTLQCCSASGIAELEHILNYMDGYRITVLELLFEQQFCIETVAVMKSLPNVRFLHINNFHQPGNRTDLCPVSILCASPDHLPSLEILSVIYDPTWTLSWWNLSADLALRPAIRTLIVHDRFAVPRDEKRHHYREAFEVMGRQGLEIRWVP
ncbi:hypothetical protein PENSPDRAFT_654282 [Peniophora sp. CONT]|nr:hypothetical protein PENSPDRAFT_654282 [Peniophora sp. CONT]